jgi:hypothetical protein
MIQPTVPVSSAVHSRFNIEDRGPISGSNYLFARDSRDARLSLREVLQLLGCSDANQLHVAILDYLTSEMLPDVNVLCTLSTINDGVSPLDALGPT